MTGMRSGDPEGRNSDLVSEEPRCVVMTPSKLTIHTWLFRGTIVAVAYVTVLCCSWVFNSSASPFLNALPPALGVMIGFFILHLVGWDKRTLNGS